MSPEQLAADVDHWEKVDLFALGVVLYECLGGERKRTASSQSIEALPSIPADLLWVLRRATAFDPADRYPSMTAFACDLERWEGGSSVRLRPRAMAGSARRWASKNRSLVAVGALAALASLALVGGQAVDELQDRQIERSAELRWSGLSARLEGQDYAQGSREFKAFVDNPELQGRPVVAEAWLWRSLRPDIPADAELEAAANAAFASEDPTARAAGLSRLAEVFHERALFHQLALLDQLTPEALTDDAAVDLAFAYGEYTQAASDLGDPTLLDLFARASVLDVDARDHLHRPDWMPTRTSETEHLRGTATVSGRNFVASSDQSRVLLEQVDGAFVRAHAPTTALSSYGTTLLAADIDQDGEDELVLGLAQPFGYGLRVFDVPPSGPIEELGTLRIGDVGQPQLAETPWGPRVVVARSPALYSVPLFGKGEPPPAALLVLSWTKDGPTVEHELPLGPQTVEIYPFPAALDLNDDGVDEVLVLTRDQAGETCLELFASAGGVWREPIHLHRVAVVSVTELDDDEAPELVGYIVEIGTLAFGMGEPLPLRPRPVLQATEGPAVLEALGLFAQSAQAWEELADQDPERVDDALGEASRAWQLAEAHAESSRVLERLGDLEAAADEAVQAFELDRAAALSERWRTLATPDFELDPTRALPDTLHTELPASLKHDVIDERIVVNVPTGPTVLVAIPMRGLAARCGSTSSSSSSAPSGPRP